MDYELTKKDTNIAKGIAILLMVLYHLFRFPERAGGNSYISIFSIGGINLEYILSDFGQITIGIFVFLSAYGLYRVYSNRELKLGDLINRIFKFLLNYWIVFIIFVFIGISVLHVYEFNLKELLLTFFCFKSAYNGEWWFVQLYIELLIVFPIIRVLLNKSKRIVIMSIGIILISSFVIKFLMKFLLSGNPELEFLIGYIINLFYWEVAFCIGYTFARFNIFTIIKNYVIKKNLDKNSVYLVIVLMIVTLRISGWLLPKYLLNKDVHATYLDFILVPLLIFCITNISNKSKIKNILQVLGKYSNNIWLTHTFFCYYYFPHIIFMPKISVLVFIWLMLLSLITSVIIQYIYIKLCKLFDFESSNLLNVKQ